MSSEDDAPDDPVAEPEPEAAATDQAFEEIVADLVAESASTAAVAEPEAAPAPAPTDPLADQLGAVDERVARVEDAVAGISRSVAELARLGQRHADHVGELHSDNQRLRSGEIALVIAPMHRDLVRLHDEVQSLEESAPADAATDLALVRARVTDVLQRWGINRHVPEIGDPFDAKLHQGIGRVDSNDGADGSVARVRRAGFTYEDGRPLRVAEVEVFRAVAVPEPAPEPEPEPDPVTASESELEPQTEPEPHEPAATDDQPQAREP